MSSIPGGAASGGMEDQPKVQPAMDKSSGTIKDVENEMFIFDQCNTWEVEYI